MKNIWTIMKKEFSRFFKDKRLVLALVLPGILIYVIYSFLGQGVFDKIGKTDENYVYQIHTVNMPDSFKAPFAENEKTISSQLLPTGRRTLRLQIADKKPTFWRYSPKISRGVQRREKRNLH